MNWVGGSRNRLVMKNDAKKQREFFEKRKMQQKLKQLGLPLPASPPGASSGSMDLVTLFVVNQIAAKKDIKDPPKVAVLGSCKAGSKHKRRESLVLPMSPCSPSHLSLAESPSQHSVQGIRKRTHVIPQGFKCRQLSPVLESAFSDNSASDYLPPRADPLSPFSTSSASSGQGIFPLQFSFQQRSQTQPQPYRSPPPWDSSELEQTKFQPFSQPRGMTHDNPWSCASNPLVYQLETPKAAQVLFGNAEPDKMEIRQDARQDVRFSFSQPAVDEPILDFTLNQLETEPQFEEDVFRGFFNDEYKREAKYVRRAKSKIYLKDETPIKSATPQTVPDSECGVEHPNGTYTNLSGPGDMASPMNGCEYLPSYSCEGGYLSSDSSDEEECCQPRVNSPDLSCINQACCADTPRTNQGSQGKPRLKHAEPRSSTPLIKAKMDLGDLKVIEYVARPDTVCGIIGQELSSSTAQCLSPHSLAQTQSCGLCKCKKTSGETREVGTQTVPTVETRDASSQCGDSVTKDPKYLPPVDVSVQHPATGRQTNTAAEPNTHTVSSENWGGGKYMFWSINSKDYTLSGSCTSNKFSKSDNSVIPKSPINSFLDALIVADDKGKKTGEIGGETGQQENGPMMKNLSDEVREGISHQS